MSNVLAKFINTFTRHGFEEYGRYYSDYRGFVTDNNDPDYKGRLKINVPEIHGVTTPNYWAWSKGIYAASQAGFYVIPKKGDAIWVSFEGGDPSKPVWTYGWWGETEAPTTGKVQDMTNYLFQAGGHRLEFDESNSRVRITNKSGFVLEMNNNGIVLGKEDSGDESAVLGDTLQQLLENCLQGLVDAKVLTQIGAQPLINATTFAALKQQVKNIKSTKISLIK